MKTFWHNLRYTLRALEKNPRFAVVAVLSLALGIGASTAIFTLINALLLRSLPVRHPDRLVEVSLVRLDSRVPFSYPMFRELERDQRVLSGLIGVDLGYQWHAGKMLNVEVDGVLSQNHLLWVTENFYSELGVAPYLGRLFSPGDADPGNGIASDGAVISYEFWQRRFGSVPNVVGKQIRVEGHPFTIMGVTRKSFPGLTRGEPPEITLPIIAAPQIEDGTLDLERGGAYWLFILDCIIPEPSCRRDGRGRPWKDRRTVLNGILWVLRTGAPWADVPDRYPSSVPAMGPLRSDERNPRSSCARTEGPRCSGCRGTLH